jgi:homoserine kinase type II
MAVYTQLSEEDFMRILASYSLGELEKFQGITDGIENTNYALTVNKQSRQQSFILTIFEELPAEDLPYHIELMNELFTADIPVPQPIANKQGQFFQLWKGKPFAIFSFLSGKHTSEPNTEQCRTLGETMARFHLAAANMPQNHSGIRDLVWLEQCVNRAGQFLDKEDKWISEKTLQEFLALHSNNRMPKGLIHGDLFKDNVLFDQDTLTGVIDFYSAGEGYLLYDFAVLVNDWCSKADGSICRDRYEAACKGYNNIRPFIDAEISNFALLNQIAAMRFWLSRVLFNEESDSREDKNPKEYRRIFFQRIAEPLSLNV